MIKNNYFYVSLVILAILFSAGIMVWLTHRFYPVPNWPVLAAALIALLVGITALFKDIIYHFTCGPRIDIDFRFSESAEIYEGKNDFSYNLAIRNKGFISAKRVRAKIRERDEEKERDYVSWLNLIRPLSDVWIHRGDGSVEKIKSEGEIYMDSLSSNEEDYFSFGIHDKNNNNFILKTNTKIGLNNQTITIENKTKRFYSLEIVADNMPPCRYSLQITNNSEQGKKVDIVLMSKKESSERIRHNQGGQAKLACFGIVILRLSFVFITPCLIYIWIFEPWYINELPQSDETNEDLSSPTLSTIGNVKMIISEIIEAPLNLGRRDFCIKNDGILLINGRVITKEQSELLDLGMAEVDVKIDEGRLNKFSVKSTDEQCITFIKKNEVITYEFNKSTRPTLLKPEDNVFRQYFPPNPDITEPEYKIDINFDNIRFFYKKNIYDNFAKGIIFFIFWESLLILVIKIYKFLRFGHQGV